MKLHQQETEYLEAATFALEQRYAGIDSEARQDYQSARDDIKNRVLYSCDHSLIIFKTFH